MSGGCCISVRFTISEEEIGPFLEAEKKGLPSGHAIEINYDGDDMPTYDYDSGDDSCIFLGEDNLCKIYENRPTICKTYPLNWQLHKDELSFYLDFECVLSHILPVHQFYVLANSPEIKDRCMDLGEMEINTRDKRYVNITKLHDLAIPIEIIEE